MDFENLISIIVPIYNGSAWINQCFQAIIQQQLTPDINLEVCVCNDASTDNTLEILGEWDFKLKAHNIPLKIYKNLSQKPAGVGYAKNKAVSISSGTYLCFQDVDDVMMPNRILEQYNKAVMLPNNTLIGSRFQRAPKNSTERYTNWANSLSHEQLEIQIYTSHGPTVVMPTWFCHRNVFERVGGFSEQGKGTPEDLIFFYRHLDLGGSLSRVDLCLLTYTYHLNATTFTIDEETIWNIRLDRLQNTILTKWEKFTIWNAGKQGRKFYNSLSWSNQAKVVALCDVDEKKIGKQYIPFNSKTRKTSRPLNIIHFKDTVPPLIICVKMDMTNGKFEKNLQTLNLQENIGYVWFS